MHGDILGVGYIEHTGTQGLEVGALAVDLAAQPELVIELVPVAVNHTLAGNGESVDTLGIDKSCEIVDGLTLKTGLDDLVVRDGVAALELAPLGDVQVGAGLEEERAAQECPFGNDDDASAVCSSLVDDTLQGLGLDDGAVAGLYAVFGHHILLAEL